MLLSSNRQEFGEENKGIPCEKKKERKRRMMILLESVNPKIKEQKRNSLNRLQLGCQVKKERKKNTE